MTAGAAPRPALGLLNQMWAEATLSDREVLRTALDEIRFADQTGYDSVWIGEHHLVRPTMRFYGRVPATEMFLSHIAATTSRITVGTGVKLLTMTSALRAAEDISLLHLLTDGRIVRPLAAEASRQVHQRLRRIAAAIGAAAPSGSAPS